MKVGSKEFYEFMDQFEKDLVTGDWPFRISDLSRSRKEETPAGYFYNNGELNNYFHAYMLGFSYAKSLSNIVKACNSYEDMLEALKVAERIIARENATYVREYRQITEAINKATAPVTE